jgi:transaldolase
VEPKVESLRIKLFADGADIKSMIEMSTKPQISGLTTNPTLMRKAGITDYVNFAKEALKEIRNKPISFEVFSDEMDEMIRQAEKIASWGENVYVKIPITNTRGESTQSVIKYLTENGVKVNVTAIMTVNQIDSVINSIFPGVSSYISVFAGRIADTGRDPIITIKESLVKIQENQNLELIWASPRELLNVFQADEIGCHIITATTEILQKLENVGRDLDLYSLETVTMFFEDALKSNYSI